MAGILERLMGKNEGMGMRDRNAYKEAVGASIDASETEAPVERSPQGVVGYPRKNKEGLAELLVKTGRAKNMDEARQKAGYMTGIKD